ncbi:hypothetical protein ACFLYT_00185 [Nanoarchaeota archaeon]
MPFSKSFPKTIKGSNYPRWEEVAISEEEEIQAEQQARLENNRLMKQCIEDAKDIIEDKNLKKYQTDMIHLAIALFEKRASHAIYWKENKAKEKFDKK